jgi:hypothetical protein
MLPFQDHVIAGTTDTSCEVTPRPAATQQDVTFILDALSGFLGIQVGAGKGPGAAQVEVCVFGCVVVDRGVHVPGWAWCVSKWKCVCSAVLWWTKGYTCRAGRGV